MWFVVWVESGVFAPTFYSPDVKLVNVNVGGLCVRWIMLQSVKGTDGVKTIRLTQIK